MSITPPRFYERFCVPLQLGANWDYWPSEQSVMPLWPSETRPSESWLVR
jgi:hypothetical protein